MERFLIRGWELNLPGCGGTSAMARGLTLAANWLHGPQPISNHPVGLWIPHCASSTDPGYLCFLRVGVVEIWSKL